MVEGLRGQPFEGRLRDLNLFSLCKRRLRWGLVAAYNHIRGQQQGLGENLFTRAPLGVTRNNGHKLREERFRLDIRKNDFTVRVARAWNRLPGEAVLSPSLEIFKRRLDRHLAGVL